VVDATEHVTGRLSDGQTFGRYQIVRTIGEGGMGAVYEAVHVGLKKRVALKTLLPSIAQNAEAQVRFLREGEAASRINHPNVVDVTDVGSENGIPYLVMEYLEGETLGDFIARKGPLEVSVAVDLLLPSIAAVAAGHDMGVIHRDLKPQNVFLARGHWGEPVPKILDFGVSKILDGKGAALTGTMAVLGTASYMSPEQARGARVVEAASDQYAMGLIFHEMLTATRGHDGEHPLEVLHRIASGVIPDTRALRPDLPFDVEAVVKRMLSPNPRDRFPSLRAVARTLIKYANEKVRVTYADAFREPEPGMPGAGPADARTTSGADTPSRSGAKSGGTRLLSGSGGASATTLGQSAAESAAIDLRGGRRGPRMLLIGGAVVAIAAVAVVLARKPSGPVSAAPPAEASPASPAPSAELPAQQPAVVAAPAVVSVPPPPAAEPPGAAPAAAEPAPKADHAVGSNLAPPRSAKPRPHARKHEGSSQKSHGDPGIPILE
jgi:serine/threonine protein kinase